MTLQLLARRAQFQAQAGARSAVFHGFQFTNVIVRSGITFLNQPVDDAGRDYKAVQYDHGNAVTAADVDGDGQPDLYFTTQLGSNELWRNLGGGRFQNITATAGVGMVDQISVGAAFADVDNDGDPDLFVTTVRKGNRLFLNQGGGRFDDRTEAAGLGYSGHSSGAAFLDYDRDGRLDLMVANIGRFTSEVRGRGGYFVGLTNAFDGHLFPERAEANLLYHNEGGGKFREVSTEMGLSDRGWTGEAAVVDLNEDGFPDLYVTNMQGDDRYWENEGGRRWVDRTAERFP